MLNLRVIITFSIAENNGNLEVKQSLTYVKESTWPQKHKQDIYPQVMKSYHVSQSSTSNSWFSTSEDSIASPSEKSQNPPY